jgi:hypothetical protein
MTYTYADPRRRRGPASHTPLVFALVLAVVWSLFEIVAHSARFVAEPLGVGLGRILVGALVFGAVAWGVVYLGFTRRASPERGVRYALLLIGVPLLLQAGLDLAVRSAARYERVQKAEVRTAADEMEASVRALANSGSAAPRVDTKPRAAGEAGEFERVFKAHFAKLQDDQQAYRRDIAASGLLDALKPDHLARDSNVRAARASLTQARALVKSYRARYDARRAELRDSVQHSALTPADKAGLIAGMDRAAVETNPDEMWDLEDRCLDEMEAAVEILRRPHGVWIVRSHKLLFTDPADLQAYQMHIAALHGLAQQETALRDRTLQRMITGVQQFRRGAQ